MKFVKKYALILDSKDGRVVKLSEKLKDLNFRIVLATDPESALEIVEKSNQISTILINGEICSGPGVSLIEKIGQINTTVTTIWFEPKGVKTKFDRVKPRTVIDYSSSISQLKQAISSRLLANIYPEHLLSAFSESCESFLRRSFKVFATPREAFLRSSNRLFAEATALLYMNGDNVKGQIAVTTTLEYATEIYKRVSNAEEFPRSKTWDLLGEIGNMVAGSFKACFPESEHCKIGLPTILYGEDIEIITKYNQPSLVLAFDEEANTIFVEFIFDTFDAEQALKGDTIEDIADEGDICFL
ncbi:MAG: chemotaxis protein CheX [Oligoflexales bacterium]|nr:chemotaxis protein CheX [Oligoflexales bacterium]